MFKIIAKAGMIYDETKRIVTVPRQARGYQLPQRRGLVKVEMTEDQQNSCPATNFLKGHNLRLHTANIVKTAKGS
jgi:hypothetical protein